MVELNEEAKQALIYFCENRICEGCPFKKENVDSMEYDCKLDNPYMWKDITCYDK